MEIFEYTNKGSRDENQDFVIHKLFDDGNAIFLVADGMGGYSNGREASRIVGESIIEYIELNQKKYSPAELLRKSFQYGNDNLMLKRFALKKKMGTVVAALYINNGDAFISWLGDCRVYTYRNGSEIFHTEDHSVFNELKKIKTLKIDDIEKYSSIVTKALMGDENLEGIPVKMIHPEKGDVFFVCSDGFHKQLNLDDYVRMSSAEMNGNLNHLVKDMDDNFSIIRITI